MVDAFDREAEKSIDEDRKIYFDNYFAREAGLNEEEQQILKTVARNFMSAFQASSYRDRLTLSAVYRRELKNLFGDDFNRFDSFVRAKIAPDFKIFKSDDGEVVSGASGTSSISVNNLLHRLEGSSSTIFMFFARNPQLTCAVSGDMNGPNVSESEALSNNCSQNLTVNMYSTEYLPNSQYCVNGTHVFAGNSLPPSSSCLTTQAASSKVIHTTFEQLQTDDLPIDVNPNTGGGLRIFPDKKLPTEMTERRKILVRAKIGSNAAGVKVYFRNFDFDDPSANAAPVDANGSAGNDNNGNVDGTTNTRAGQFSASLSQYDCQISSGGAECFTDSNGEAIVYYTLTMQPGDNFSVVAGTDSVYLGGLTLAADGVNLKDTSNVQTPVSRTSDITECYRSAVNACRTDMLTVWRRLHIERDFMSNVVDNKVTGTFAISGKIPSSQFDNVAIPINISPSLEPDRFVNGRITFGTNRRLSVVGNGENSVYVKNTTGTIIGISQGQAFTLYDDDDYNNDDGGNPDGDTDEPIISLLESFKYLSAEDGNHSDGRLKNVYASAYLKPEYFWAQNVAKYNQTNVVFSLNVSVANVGTQLNANRNSNNDEKDEFWIAYFLVGYQGAINEDADGFNINSQTGELQRDPANPGITEGFGYIACDCYQSGTCIGTSCAAVIPKGGFGSLIYQEVMQDVTRTWLREANTVIEGLGTTVPHELGHQFGLKGDNKPNRSSNTYRIMDYVSYLGGETDFYDLHPEHINIIRRRIKSPGQ